MISWSNSLPKENTIITKKIYAINGAQLYQYVCHEQYPPVVLVRVRKKDLHHILKKIKDLKGLLAEPSKRMDDFSQLTIKHHRIRNHINTTHNQWNLVNMETHTEHISFQKTPLDPIICFTHIQLESKWAYFTNSSFLKRMHNLIGNKNIIKNKSARN